MSAGTIPVAADPERQPTAAPKLCAGLTVLSTPSATLIEGGPRTVRLAGFRIPDGSPHLECILDGANDHEDIATALAIDTQSVARLVETLQASDLLDATTRPTDHLPRPVRTFYSRTLGSRYPTGADEHLGRLETAAVLLLGRFAGRADLLAEDLRAAGLADVSVDGRPGPATPEQATAAVERSARPFAVVDLDLRVDLRPENHLALITQLETLGVPVLHCRLSEHGVDIGPITMSSSAPCPDCVQRSLAEVDAAHDGDDATGSLAGASAIALGAARVVAEVIRAVGATVAVPQPAAVCRVANDGFRTSQYVVVPYEDCATCAASESGVSWTTSLGGTFERSVHGLGAVFARDSSNTAHETSRLREASRRREIIAARPARALPEELEVEESGSLEQRLAAVLALTAGYRPAAPDEVRTRWAPCAGSFGSIAPHVVSYDDPFGLPGQAFRYDDSTHSVRAVGKRAAVAAESSAAQFLAGSREGSIGLVLVAATARLAEKYRSFALRLAHLDTGAALAQLISAADLSGFDVQCVPAWDASFYDLVGVVPQQELITAVAVLTDRRRAVV